MSARVRKIIQYWMRRYTSIDIIDYEIGKGKGKYCQMIELFLALLPVTQEEVK